jgi:hypothetical protein
MQEITEGMKLISAERIRQITEENFTPGHDVDHAPQLTEAATSYLHDAIRQHDNPSMAPELRRRSSLWPWAPEYYKPADVVRELEKAGALIAAALDSILASRDMTAEEVWYDCRGGLV